MKKLGIITFTWAHNYGAILQAFALQEILKENNKVNLINYEEKEDKKIYMPRLLSKNLIKIAINVILLPKNLYRYNKFNKFINKNLLLSCKYHNINELKLDSPNYDVYITGSDQVWNLNITRGLSDAYTLNFGRQEVRRISYAASIGDISLIEKNKKIYREKLKILDNISVREEDAKLELKKILDKDVKVVLDPTLLLSRSQWDERIAKLNRQNQKYILAYMVEKDVEYTKIVNYLSEMTGLKIIHFEKIKRKMKNALKSAYTKDPFEFVNLIKNADYVVTTSFHATVFSIIYNKKFFVIPHKKTGARVTSLLNKLNIKGRDFSTFEDFKNIDYNFESDWKNINKKLEGERKKSLNWLNDAINN